MSEKPFSREMFLFALAEAYYLGSQATKAVNFGRKGFTANMRKRERGYLNNLFRDCGFAPMSDEEYARFE